VLVRQRAESIAVLRCLGATAGRTFTIYLIEATVMGLAGSVLGATAGVALQRLLPGLLAQLLPVSVAPVVSWRAVGLGIGIGVWVTLAFSLLPILGVRRISPLQALRRPFNAERPWRDVWWGVAMMSLAATTVLLTVHQVGTWRLGATYAAGIAGTLLVLWAVAVALTRTLRNHVPAQWSYVWRQGLANLHRPANQTATLILAIGFAAFLLATLFLVQHNLLRQLSDTGGPARPNLVLFDIQPDQLAGMSQELRHARLPVLGPTPIVPMRIRSINGRPVSSLLRPDSLTGRESPQAWALRREYRSTYRDTIASTERVIAGRWQGATSSPVRISVEEELAQELGLRIGDEVVWDVQGVSLASRVGSLREVDWARFEPNFFVVFGSGALEQAPQTMVLLTRIASPAERGRFQRRIAERYPNVSTLDLSLLQESLERLVDRVALAVRFMALFSLGVGVLVLIAALATSRFQRIREGALLRTLGATRAQLFGIILAEYLGLGLLAAGAASALAISASWALARFVFESRFTIPVLPLGGLVLTIVALTVAVGLANSREVVRRPPLQVLREE
jgi:putative ABC transport system permease protein